MNGTEYPIYCNRPSGAGNKWAAAGPVRSSAFGGQPYMVDMQELVVWTALNWRISKWEDISFQCDKLASSDGWCWSAGPGMPA